MTSTDKTYTDMLRHVLEHGKKKSDRTGTGTKSVFGYMMKFDLSRYHIPLLTTKKMFTKSIIHELLWFLRGSTNIKYLVENDVGIWTDWPYKQFKEAQESIKGSSIISIAERDFMQVDTMEKFEQRIREDDRFAEMWGNVGNMYGEQWINWKNYPSESYGILVKESDDHINQLQGAIDILKTNPDSRRNLISAWNLADLKDMALPPCHYAFQLYSSEMTEEERILEYDAYLDLHELEIDQTKSKEQWMNDSDFPTRKASLMFIMRSTDLFLGGPFDIASYGILLHMIGQTTNHVPGELSILIGDAHIYLNHIEQVKIQLSRSGSMLKPQLRLSINKSDIFDYRYDDFKILNYEPDSYIKAPIAV